MRKMTTLSPSAGEYRMNLSHYLRSALFVILILSATLLTSCMAGPDYEAPIVPTPEAYKYAPGVDLKPMIYEGP